jgi:hypothetical protein
MQQQASTVLQNWSVNADNTLASGLYFALQPRVLSV